MKTTAAATKRPRDHYPIACAAALLLTLAVYANHFHNDFHFDDSHTIQNNAFIRSVDNIPLFFMSADTFSAKPANQSYRPLVTTTLAVDYRLGGGLNPVAFHVTSFGLYLVQCGLVLVLFRRVLDRAQPAGDNRWPALLAATWYAVHPAIAETVNYIIARSEILSTVAVVLGLVLFSGGGVARRYHLYLVPAVLGILAKESGAMFAPLLLLYVVLFEPGLSWKTTVPSFVACFGTVAFSIWMAAAYSPGGPSRWQYLLTQPFVIVHYVITLFLPLRLSADTQWPLVANPFDLQVIIGAACIAAALGGAWLAARTRETRPIAFGILWFFVALLPTSSLVPLAEPMNDHRMFFPFVGLILAVVWGAWLAISRSASSARLPLTAAAIVILLVMAYGTVQRNTVWRTEESLWLDATTKSPDNGRALMNYGVIQMNKGNLPGAADYFDRALRYTPDYSYLHVNIAVLNVALGRPSEADTQFREALRDDPTNPVSYTYYARWLKSVGRTEEARLYATRAVELSPADVAARALLTDLERAR
ncbi:MAG: tetratricopeptide repeat protein [Acidobacteria bacterium]|nr:tetratricopeptide repeat protein [Acidobacteriota bacterium]